MGLMYQFNCEGKKAWFQVSYNGIGINEKDLPKVLIYFLLPVILISMQSTESDTVLMMNIDAIFECLALLIYDFMI